MPRVCAIKRRDAMPRVCAIKRRFALHWRREASRLYVSELSVFKVHLLINSFRQRKGIY